MEFQALQRQTFEEVRRMHRELIDPNDQEKIMHFDTNGHLIRRRIREKQKSIRDCALINPDLNPTLQFDDYLCENKYFVCTLENCSMCAYLLKQRINAPANTGMVK